MANHEAKEWVIPSLASHWQHLSRFNAISVTTLGDYPETLWFCEVDARPKGPFYGPSGCNRSSLT